MVGLNLGNFAYPLAEILFGRLALELTVVFDATNQIFLLAVAHAIHTVHTAKIDPSSRAEGDASIWGSVKQSLVRQLRNLCLLACAGAVAYRAMYGAGVSADGGRVFKIFGRRVNKPLALLALDFVSTEHGQGRFAGVGVRVGETVRRGDALRERGVGHHGSTLG